MDYNNTPVNIIESKVVLLGNSDVGKSAMAIKYTEGFFQKRLTPTIGASFQSKTLNLDGKNKVKFLIWDTAGQDRFRSLTPMYYRGSSVAVLVYDITVGNSFEQVRGWVEELKSNILEEIIMVICGNKVDLNHKRVVKREVAAAYAEEIKAMYYETSAKENIGIDEMFLEIAKRIIYQNAHNQHILQQQQQQQNLNRDQILKLQKQNSQQKLNNRKSLQPPPTNYLAFNSSFNINSSINDDDDDQSLNRDTSSQCCN
ncbi:Rab GTPase [Tieghemostelium lacteum]|uniref:Rab GTPase n=1 Tax=Tieghemostelium lacteum TaxID=361077 RepID=A0A152A067_TIELA|nr:Rab GTPase [Tieghemostelium lacteum]|eukprot:KYQ99637.1 Rab GTPase [Tieghemostelium lacteum]